jgi:hypothetical protein
MTDSRNSSVGIADAAREEEYIPTLNIPLNGLLRMEGSEDLDGDDNLDDISSSAQDRRDAIDLARVDQVRDRKLIKNY